MLCLKTMHIKRAWHLLMSSSVILRSSTTLVLQLQRTSPRLTHGSRRFGLENNSKSCRSFQNNQNKALSLLSYSMMCILLYTIFLISSYFFVYIPLKSTAKIHIIFILATFPSYFRHSQHLSLLHPYAKHWEYLYVVDNHSTRQQQFCTKSVQFLRMAKSFCFLQAVFVISIFSIYKVFPLLVSLLFISLFMG